MVDDALDYLRERLQAAVFVPYPWDGEDENLRAFRSKEELIAWYCQPPGDVGQPYRDRGFYTRELAYLSKLVRPRLVVEFGTSLGIGVCLLHWLNPGARLVTVDTAAETFLPGDQRVQIGHMALYQDIPCEYVTMNSWDYVTRDAGLCFIDADHSHEAVLKDSERAWRNRNPDRWAIAWHDHNDRHPGEVEAVGSFCTRVDVELQWLPDSDTVWIEGHIPHCLKSSAWREELYS